MAREIIFERLTVSSLDQIVKYLRWDPSVSESPKRLLSDLSDEERRKWLDGNRAEIEDRVSWVGTPIFSYALGKKKSYHQIVRDLAAQIGAEGTGTESIEQLEKVIVHQVWKDILARMKPEEKQEFISRIKELASRQAPLINRELAAFAELSAEQLSDFGVYMLASTLLDTLNSALGIRPGSAAFTGLSAFIIGATGPILWPAMGLLAIQKMVSPNYKKLLPVVILIAAERAQVPSARTEKPRPILLPPSTLEDAREGTGVPTGRPTPILLPPSTLEGAGVGTELTDVLPPRTLPTSKPRIDEPSRAGVEEPSYSGIGVPYDIDQIKRHIEEASRTRYAPKEKRKPAPCISRVDKRNFDLRPENREICEMAAFLDSSRHFLEMSPDEQATIKELVKEEHLKRMEQERASKNEQRKLRDQEERALKAAKGKASKRDVETAELRKRYRPLRNLEFEEAALERLIQFENSQRQAIEDAFGIINLEKHKFRGPITDTDPKVYETRAAWDYRIYHCRNGSKTTIRLIGDKGTQESDIAWLKHH
jgi:uncharacterized protein YaaW (UPF0174 family)/predicted DNA binding CopG/RHH family protein